MRVHRPRVTDECSPATRTISTASAGDREREREREKGRGSESVKWRQLTGERRGVATLLRRAVFSRQMLHATRLIDKNGDREREKWGTVTKSSNSHF